MDNGYLDQLEDQIVNNNFAAPSDVRDATRIRDEVRTGRKPAVEGRRELEALWESVKDRRHGGKPTSASTSAKADLFTIKWDSLETDLQTVEGRWQRLASVQFWLAVLLVPGSLLLMGLLARHSPPPRLTDYYGLFALIGGVSIAQMFLLLRVHQQARLAHERLTEKRVGLNFLRLVYERDLPEAKVKALVSAGTTMFLGHYAAPSQPLGPDDVSAIGGVLKTSV